MGSMIDQNRHPPKRPVIVLIAKAFQKPNPPRTIQEVETLIEAGYQVHVFAWDRDAEYPRVENVHGASVHSWSLISLRKFTRLGLAIGGLLFQVVLTVQAIRLIGRLKCRPIVFAHDINTLVPGCLLRVSGLCSALVYDCREFTYGVYSEWFHPLAGAIVRVVEEKCLGTVDTVVTVSDLIAGYLGKFNRSVELIYNCPRLADIPAISKDDARVKLGLPRDAFLVSFVGTLRYGCRLELLLAVTSQIQNENVRFLVVGDGPLTSAFKRAASKISSSKFAVLPRVSRETALTYTLASDLSWVVYGSKNPSLNARVGLPWKFFESLACGVPMIVEADTLRAKLINMYRCGVVFDNDDPSHVAEVISSLAEDRGRCQDMKLAARQAASLYSWETMSEKLVGILK